MDNPKTLQEENESLKYRIEQQKEHIMSQADMLGHLKDKYESTKAENWSLKAVLNDEIAELEKQLFTVGIDVKLSITDPTSYLKHLTQLLIDAKQQNERILNQPTSHTRLNNAEVDRLNERLMIAGCGFAELDGFNAVQHVYDLVDHLCKVNVEYQALLNRCKELSEFVKQLDTEPVWDFEDDDDLDEPTD